MSAQLSPPKQELLNRIEEIRYRLQQEDNLLEDLFHQISAKKRDRDAAQKLRDQSNARVRALIEDAKKHMTARDGFQGQTKDMRRKVRDYSHKIRDDATRISKDKEVRAQFHREAKGTLDGLAKQFSGAMDTLANMDLSVKNEIIMVEMIMELRQRYGARKVAEALHQNIKATYQDLKQVEGEAQTEFAAMGDLVSKAQTEHQAAMDLFAQKDKERQTGQEHHQKFLDVMKEMKEIGRQIDEKKAHKNELLSEMKRLNDELGHIEHRKREEDKSRKLVTAREKATKGNKMSLDDLKLLVESGSLGS